MIKSTITIDEIIQQLSVEDAKTLIMGVTDSIQTEGFTREMFEFFKKELDMYKPRTVKVPEMKYRVTIMEFERGWGSRVDDTEDFPTYEEALSFVKRFNAVNTEDIVPDYYTVAMEPVPIK